MNKFIPFLQKGVYPYINIRIIGKNSLKHHYQIKKTTSHLNMEDNTDADYTHVCKDFKICKIGEDHNLYVQRDSLLLANVFENLRNICLEIYELNPARSLSSAGLAWQAALEKTKVKLDLSK